MKNFTSRSWLIARLSNPAAVVRAAQSGADVVVLDLVELVTDKQKAAAREQVRVAVQQVRAAGPRVFVQTTPATHEADLRASVCAELNGIVVARAGSRLAGHG